MFKVTLSTEKTSVVSFSCKKLTQPGDANTKLRKSSGRGYATIGLSLSPHRLSWKRNALGEIELCHADDPDAYSVNSCPMASVGCAGACLDHQGMASVFERIRMARIAKTIYFHEHRGKFLDQLSTEIGKAQKSAERKNLRLAVRLNVFSDLPWEKLGIVDQFPNVQFYDYTAIPARAGLLRKNYWVTLSRKENNDSACIEALNRCCNVAVCFSDSKKPRVGNRSAEQQLPKKWNGFQVIDGDTTDLRFDDLRGRKRGRVIGLRLKAHSWAEREAAIDSGFAVEF